MEWWTRLKEVGETSTSKLKRTSTSSTFSNSSDPDTSTAESLAGEVPLADGADPRALQEHAALPHGLLQREPGDRRRLGGDPQRAVLGTPSCAGPGSGMPRSRHLCLFPKGTSSRQPSEVKNNCKTTSPSESFGARSVLYVMFLKRRGIDISGACGDLFATVF